MTAGGISPPTTDNVSRLFFDIPFDSLQPWPLAVIFVAFLVRGTFGFGDALVGMPLLLLLMGKDVAAPLVAMLSMTLALGVMCQDWRKVHVRDAASLIGSAFVGIVIGLLFLAEAAESLVTGLLGVLVLLFAAYSLFTPGLGELKTDRTAPLFGVVAGILSGAYNAPGPPLVMYGALRGWTAESFRATMQAFFLPTALAVVIGHGVAGRINPDVLAYFVAGLPIIAVCILLGRFINSRIRTEKFERILYVLLAVIGLSLIVRAV